MRAVEIVGVIAVAAAGLGCFQTNRRVEDLATPVLVWSQGNGLCSRILAVDAGRTVWVDQGCETPVDLDEVRSVTAAQMDDLWMKFDALPLDYSAPGCDRMMHGFQRYAPPSSTVSVAACGGTIYDDLTGLPDAFLPLAETLKALE